VVDVETTGMTPARDRIVEIAIVRTDNAGAVVDEWATLLDPEGPVGATRVHGITAAEVRRAPRFRDVLGELNARMAGRALVAHNARFDLAFVAAEYARAGQVFPAVPYLCTLEASRSYHPYVVRRRLRDLCGLCGIPLQDNHSALGDARATARLLAHYIDVGNHGKQRRLTKLPGKAAKVSWPVLPSASTTLEVRRPANRQRPAAAPPGSLWRLLNDLPVELVVREGAPTTSQPYLELLFQSLEDGVLTRDEADALADLAHLYSLTHNQVVATHSAFLVALARRIGEDGTVTGAERREFSDACELLGFFDGAPLALLEEPARHA
jgi:DNA polymerase-3 subunit epsilon